MDKIDIEELSKRKTTQDNVYLQNQQKEKNLIKPDFSPLLLKENKIGYKNYGSYKKPKFIEPESPMKSPNFKTPAQIESKNLFGTKSTTQNKTFFRKLNFDDVTDNKNFLNCKGKIEDNKILNKNSKLDKFLEDCYEEEDEEEKISQDNNNFFNMNSNIDSFGNIIPSPKFGEVKCNLSLKDESFNIDKFTFNIEKNNFDNFLKNGKTENEFKVLKTVKKDKLSYIFKVENKNTNQIFCLKKIFKTSPKNNIKIINQIMNDINSNPDKLGNQFCIKILDFWIEEEEFKPELSDINYSDKNLYILTNFCEYGDIFDYFEKLENTKFEFTENFYWDIVFEMMICLLYINNLGYLHLDIQPANYLVDQNGYIKLNDYSLSHKINEMKNIYDFVEGDTRYIAKEIFHFSRNSEVDPRCDVFSLGMTLLELIAKIDLPYNGTLWHEFRSDNFKLPKKYFENSNIKNVNEFFLIISEMISPLNKRPTLIELINKYPKLSERYKLLSEGKYKKSTDIPKLRINEDGNLGLKTIPSIGKL